MKVSTYVDDPRPSGPLRITATRYVPEKPLASGLTLILAHATGTHKETWTPLIRYLFDLDSSSGGTSANILEAWSIECPNHGESAVLNEAEITTQFSGNWTGWEYPRGMLAFLLSQPAGVDFYQRKLVAVGHSHGGNSLVILHSLKPDLPFASFILLDPTLGKESAEKDNMQRILTQLTWNKRDTWPSREAAIYDLGKQPGFRNWHPEVLRLFAEKGMRDHPASQYPDPWIFTGVTLSCSRAYEAACHRANDHHDFAFDVFQKLSREGPPVHLILSKADEFGATKLKEAQIQPEPVSHNITSSIQWIEKGGHMFVQSVPQITAGAIWNALCNTEIKSISSVAIRTQPAGIVPARL